MQPVSPVLPAGSGCEVVYAKDQPQYNSLPTFRTQTSVLSRWKLTDDERRHIAEGGDLFICMMNFGGPLQPVLPMAEDPDIGLIVFGALVLLFGQAPGQPGTLQWLLQ